VPPSGVLCVNALGVLALTGNDAAAGVGRSFRRDGPAPKPKPAAEFGDPDLLAQYLHGHPLPASRIKTEPSFASRVARR
jgi:hypothetical protein